MKYKALFLDVDGTLMLHKIDNVPSDRVCQAIKACTKKGIFVCLATSRPLHVLGRVLEALDIRGLCVISGGRQIYDAGKKKIIKNIFLSNSCIQPIIRVGKKFGLAIRYFDGLDDNKLHADILNKKLLGMHFPKVLPEQTETIIRELELIPNVSVHRMPAWDHRYQWIDICDEKATKLHGIAEVAKRLHISTHEMIGVGDGYNDFPLLMACGLKVAMGNAVPELKAIADFIAPSVEEDGVATVIEKFIL
jgi:HAD superfamily hydrolase (TIGR01484 family)